MSEIRRVLTGAFGLSARSLWPLARTLVAGFGFLALLLVPLWVWLNAAVGMVDLSGSQLSNGDIATLVAVMGVPALVVLIVAGLATAAAMAIVLDDVAAGRRPRAVRAVGRGVRAVPRLAVTVVPALLVVAALVALAPVVVVGGLVLVPVSMLGRRFRPQTRWASKRTLTTMVIPFGVAAMCAARWLAVPTAVVLQRTGPRASFRSSRALAGSRPVGLAVAIGVLVAGAAAVTVGAGALLEAVGANQNTRDVATVVVQGVALVVALAMAVRLFTGAGGVAAPPTDPMPPRVMVGAAVAFALLAQLAPAVWLAPPAHATVAGATLVVDDLGDGGDASPGDGDCATATGVCTLRAAVAEANASRDEVIGFEVSGTITLGSELHLAQPVFIDGSGEEVTVSGGGTTSVFFTQMEVSGGGYGAIRNLTIADGRDGVSGGPALYNSGTGAGFVLDGVTVRDHTVPAGDAFGGAVVNLSRLTIRNSTFVGNDADPAIGGSDVANRFSGEVTIVGSTFTGATGGSSIYSDGEIADVRGSILTGASSPCTGPFTGAGNVSGDASSECPGAVATLAELGLTALADNGGPTPTVRLTATSVAIGAADPADCLPADQRGAPRPVGVACDAGAYQFDPATTTSLLAAPNPSSFGEAVTLDATVAADSEPGTPTGSVRFLDGAGPLGDAPVGPAGDASLSLASLAAGPHTLTATYLPDAGFAASTSAEVAHTVEASGTSVTLTSAAGSTLAGEPVTFTVEVTAPDSIPTGSVALLDGATTLDTLTLDAEGGASSTTSTLAGGPHTITASYAGDGAHAAAVSAPLAHAVVAPSTTAITGPAGPTVFGNPASFDVVVTPTGGSPTPTGTVRLLAGEVEVGTGTLGAGGGATVAVTSLPPGTNAVRASYGGDGYNAASTSSPVDHDVTAAATQVALTTDPAGSSPFGVDVTLEATVTAPGTPGTPAGFVHLYDGSTSIAEIPIGEDGTAAFTITEPALGPHGYRAEVNPATGFATSSSPEVAHPVVAATTAVELAASSTTSTFGEAVTLDATATTLDSPRTATGSVTFRDGATVLGVVPLEGGTASLATAAIAVGSRTLTAEHHGDARFTGATSPGLAHQVSAASVTLQVSDEPDPSVFGATVVLDVTATVVAPGTGVPTGAVTVREGSTVVATGTLDAEGEVSIDLDDLAVGTHALTVDYAGDAGFAPASLPVTHTVAADAATVTLSSSDPDAELTQPVTFTATVSGTGPATPTGTVTFRDGTTVLGTAPVEEGVARLTTSTLRYGTYLVTADYSGDAGFGTATGWVTQDVDATGTATALAVDRPEPTVADVVTLTATVTGTATTVVPTGSVTFSDGAAVLAVVPVDANGQATTSRTFSRAVHTLTATFTGQPGWAASTSSPVTLIPARAPTTIALAGSPSSVAVGGSVTWTATLALAPAGPAPVGVVRFWAGTTFLGEGAIAGGVATLTVPAPGPVGPWAVHATYDGSDDHEQGTSPEVTVQVAGAATSVTAVVPPNSYVGDPIVLGAQVASTAGVPGGGVVRFTADSPGFAPRTANVDATGWATVTVDGVPAAGDWDLTATYEPASTAVFAGSSTVVPLVVSRRPATVDLTLPGDVTVGVELTVSFSVSDPTGSGPTPTGTVDVSVGGGPGCAGTVTAGQCRLTIGSPGPVTLTAAYSGGATYDPATSSPVTVTARGGIPTLAAWTPTATWASGDPVTIVWQLDGPPAAEVVVSTPFGEACRSSAVPLGSCTMTFPFDQRGQAIPVDVTYAGSDGWQPAAATVTGTVVGCYQLQLSVVPAEGGTLTGPASGNCNGGTGFLAGTQVGVAIEPALPYVFDRWLEDGSTAGAIQFTVGDGATTATAMMVVDCVEARFGRGEAYDLGAIPSLGGVVEATAPNCPTQPEVGYDAETGGSRAWYLRGTEVTFTAVPTRPDVDEVKLWEVDGEARRAAEPLTLVVDDDVQVQARFGVRCARPTFTSLGGGTVEAFTQEDCIDPAGDMAWQQGSEVGARLVPDRYHWVAHYSDIGLVRAVTTPPAFRTMGVDINTVTTFWWATDDLEVEVSFETCRRLTTAPVGPGRIDVVTAPNCPTRTLSEGAWFQPGTRVDVKAVPDAPSRQVANQRGPDGELQPTYVSVVPEFLRWEEGVDRPSYWSQLSAPPPDEPTAVVTLTEDRTVTGAFYDAGRCMAFVSEVVPAGAAQLDVAIQGDDGRCPEGEAELGDRRQATFVADPVADAPRVGWTVTTTDPESDQSVELRLENDGAPVPVKNRTLATAYVCVAVEPEITLIAPDRSEVSGSPPPGSAFVSTDVAPDCPLWENAFTVGTEVTVAALAPPAGYEFSHWEGDVSGRELDVRVRLDGSKPTIRARAVYRVRCVTITFEPLGRVPEVSPASNCPSTADEGSQPPSDGGEPWDPAGELASNQRRFIGGTAVMLDAYQLDNHDFNAWGGEGVLGREEMVEAFTQAGLPDLVALAQSMDDPGMFTADFDQTIYADYIKHSVGKQIGDDLAVAGKKIVGVLSLITIGAFEGIAVGTFRLAFGAMSLIAKAVGPSGGDAAKVFDRVQQYFDLMELTLLCTAEWSKGTPPKNPATVDQLTGNGIVPPIETTDVVTSTANLANGGVDLSEAITNYRFAKDPRWANDYSMKIPKTKYSISGTTATTAKVAWKALGVAAAVGTAIYSFISDGPGIAWEDTAAQAWNTGPGPFEDCVQREIHEAFPEHMPPPPSRD